MNKNSHIKTQIAVFAFSLTLLKAAEQRTIQIENLSLPPQEAVAALVPSVRLTKEEVIDLLSQGMSANDKGCVIKALEKVDPNLYTAPFIDAVNVLSQGMDAKYKPNVIKAVGNVNPVDYKVFIDTVNALLQGIDLDTSPLIGIDGIDKSYIIKALEEVNPDRDTEALEKVNTDQYTDSFINTVNELSQGMYGYGKGYVILAVGNVNPVDYEKFITTVNELSQGMDAKYNLLNKRDVICVVAKVNPDRYTKLFIDFVNELSQGMLAFYKTNVISAVGNVNPNDYEEFIKTVNALSQGMDAENKSHVIQALGKVEPVHYTNFINTVNELSEGMDLSYKKYVIRVLGNMEPDRYTRLFINTVNELSKGIDAYDKKDVIKALGKLNPDLYPFLQNFTRKNPRYFTDVPAYKFSGSITSDMTQQELQELLERLQRINFAKH